VKSKRGKLNISLIGAGKVGTTLTVLLHRSGHRIVSVISSTKASARKCSACVSCKVSSDRVADLSPLTDLVIIAVTDQSIQSVAESVAGVSHLRFKRLAVCHTSGAMTSDVLAPLALKGASVFSLHPIQSFPRQLPVNRQLRRMEGVWYGIEGPGSSMTIARRIVENLEGASMIVPKERKILYHLACVFASNYSVALIGAIEELAAQFAKNDLKPFRKLVETSISNAMEQGSANALTGPIIRGSVETIAEHLKSLPPSDLRNLYRSLGLYTLKLANDKGRLEPAVVEAIRDLLGT
jgi:predicted short-subunit dehydrogenase-like oxidoreductase (DUF2520 family)